MPVAAPPESLEDLLAQAEALMEEGDYRQAILCYRRAQAMAPFRKDIRELLAEAIEGRLVAGGTNLESDFRNGDFNDTRAAGLRVATHSRRHHGMGAAFILKISVSIAALIAAIILITSVRSMLGGSSAPRANELGDRPTPSGAAPSDEASPGDEAEDLDSSAPAVEPTPATAQAPSVPAAPNFDDLLADARTLIGQGQYPDAEARLEEAASVDGSQVSRINTVYGELHTAIGHQRYSEERFQDALREFQRAREYNPNEAQTFYSIGWCEHSLGRQERNRQNEEQARRHFTAARDAFQRSIELDPTLAQSHRSLGQTLILLDDREGAFAAWRRTIEIAPQSRDAERARSWLRSYNVPVPES